MDFHHQHDGIRRQRPSIVQYRRLARGKIDEILSFIANIILSFPVLVLYILVIATIGASGINIVIAITFASAPGIIISRSEAWVEMSTHFV